MIAVLKHSWALLLGVLLLLLGNGLQGTLLGIRGAIEGFDAATMSLVMSAYYVGFLVGSRRATPMIARVGHVRVFAALGSMISAAFILYAAAVDVWVWTALRFVVGFAFAGVYVVAESWLNEAASNETRGQALSLYMIAQMVGIISAQFILTLADPGGYTLFVVMSVLVSLCFTPILLTAGSAPPYQTTKPMSLVQLFRISPLGCVGTFLLGGVYAGIFGMASVFGTEMRLSVAQISAFVAAIYVGGLVFQYPIGWISDRMDRRRLIMGLTAVGAVVTLIGGILSSHYAVVLALGFAVGGVANPLYSLIIAYTNDFLDKSDMAAASGGLLFINGLGAMLGPLIIGASMTRFGPDAFFVYIGTLFALIALYALYRATRRAAPEETSSYAPVTPQASPVALELAQEVAIERAGGN
ncbi:MFS transporter [Amaricoccus sp.]|uniref:MFS transporter n=1 Tax=Amaricoccus sp. TaxID=1872485 RepID=UPI00260DEDBF|nr:MFS transporter [Amaricoccus sp.]HRO10550.1 MFS transporter [Amaricoccus sp.]